MKHLSSWLFLLGATCLWQTSLAQEIQDEIGTHVVVSGDTLRGITRQYLGTEYVWRDNWELNPHIEDPDRLRIGDRLTVITSRVIEARRAAVVEVVESVEKTVQQRPWVGAHVGDELLARDGIRTLKNSFATLRYSTASQLRLDPYSQVFLTSRDLDLLGVDRGTIEVVAGGVAMVWEPLESQGSRSDIRIISGSAETHLNGAFGTVSLHAGRSDDAAARLSMYEGAGRVSAGGGEVALREGLGVAVPAVGPPGAPEKLLRRPGTKAPARGDRLDYDNPLLVWNELANADGYRVEVCADEACQHLLYQTDLSATQRSVVSAPLGAGTRYWHVAGISNSGLLGYFSRPIAFDVERSWTDVHAPGVVIQPLDPAPVFTPTQIRVSQATAFTFAVTDDASGEVAVFLRWNEQPFTRWDQAPFELEDAARTLEFYAVDRVRNRTPTHRLIISYETP